MRRTMTARWAAVAAAVGGAIAVAAWGLEAATSAPPAPTTRPATGPATRPAVAGDAWEGAYLRYARFDSRREGQFGRALTITVRRDGDGYRLDGADGAYRHWLFKEVRPGVLSDGPGGLGTLTLGAVEYADGARARIIRADFCYEWFVLYRADAQGPSRREEHK